MGDAHRRVGRVHGLAAWTGRALHVDPEVLLLVDLDLDLIGLRQDDDRDRRGVDPAARLGRGDALDSVDTAFELEPAVGAIAADLDDGLLDPVDAGLVHAHDLGLVPVPAGVAGVHPEQLRREQGGLVATRSGPDLEDDVAVVVRVARDQEHLELVDEPGLLELQSIDLLARHGPHLVVAVARVAELTHALQLGPDRVEPTVRRHGGLEPCELLAELADQVRVGAGLRSRELGLEVVVLDGDLGQRGVQVAHANGGVSPGFVAATVSAGGSGSSLALPSSNGDRSKSVDPDGISLPSATRASSMEVMATSIMSSVGRFVVIICTRMPGYMITRTTGLWRNFAPILRIS